MIHPSVDTALVEKYNRPVPRYTSYPTVPYWDEQLPHAQWMNLFRDRFQEEYGSGMSLYIHLPFCESLCTYCGCNKKITINHKAEPEYMAALEKEWQLYLQQMDRKPIIRELHLGGGTPTFFSPGNLKRLVTMILKDCIIHPEYAFSIEGHPNNTTYEHLKTLYELGFRRISYGVQDNDPEVQRIINRIQPFANVRAATENARSIGYESVNFDLIYGLPLQTRASIERTIGQVMELMPDRIAFYSYAHVPWTSRAQRLFNESHLPDPASKLDLYLTGQSLLLDKGYEDIGMDHFALPHDELSKARAESRLHRNFMGYTVQNTGMLLGLGVSAISDVWNGFAQNDKTLHNYYTAVRNGELAIRKGYHLTAQDKAFRKYILDISCHGQTQFQPEDRPLLDKYVFPRLAEPEKDGLCKVNWQGLKLTPLGHQFIRNVCSAFDLKMARQGKHATQAFSRAI
ncbi:MAG: oxygen-independent coproporphyrinogen III oxidase [Candidatus Pseudobacter hemicellulosilyticus]|uniref:Coproporphyrinogen-III oxidase n=1 Tax=Candidatus Pseudobacter hemicellulosilyticus TaxID=3121375 RepID=A0AAJ6BFM7_9BACT|nr:MAG: oxygen-independent coproporphyrinogen III oxidase [Pseudobacter sp.]